jgi:hypothetical protein
VQQKNMVEPTNKSIHTIMSEITNRTTQKRLELIKKDMCKMSNEMSMMSLRVNEINKTYKKILMKDKPVGSSLKAIRHLR